MVRSMLPVNFSFFSRPRASGLCSPHRFGSLAATWALVTGLAVLAGCASKAPSADGGQSAGASRSSGRDGAPSDAPSDLALLPDPVPQVEPIKPRGPNKPYTVLGQSYEPIAKDVSWKEKGQASWYGTKFHGRKTASGEIFSMYGLTAAHRTLPIPSYARVRHAKSGKEIIVRINDRGPFHGARVIDLSYAAAVKLGIVNAGSAPVEIERLTFDEIRTGAWKRGTIMDPEGDIAVAAPVPTPEGALDGAASEVPAGPVLDGDVAVAAASQTPAVSTGTARALTPAAKGFWVQLAALGKRDSIDKLHQKVSATLAGLSPMLAIFHEAAHFKLQVGPYRSRREAMAAAEQARETLQLTPMVIERR